MLLCCKGNFPIRVWNVLNMKVATLWYNCNALQWWNCDAPHSWVPFVTSITSYPLPKEITHNASYLSQVVEEWILPGKACYIATILGSLMWLLPGSSALSAPSAMTRMVSQKISDWLYQHHFHTSLFLKSFPYLIKEESRTPKIVIHVIPLTSHIINQVFDSQVISHKGTVLELLRIIVLAIEMHSRLCV